MAVVEAVDGHLHGHRAEEVHLLRVRVRARVRVEVRG